MPDKVSFEADCARILDSRLFIPGCVQQGTVRVGSIFTEIDYASVDSPRIQLRVCGIVAYGHALEELPQGMTGELQLTGEGMEKLSQMRGRFTIIGSGYL